jgi:hypothetical protein
MTNYKQADVSGVKWQRAVRDAEIAECVEILKEVTKLGIVVKVVKEIKP